MARSRALILPLQSTKSANSCILRLKTNGLQLSGFFTMDFGFIMTQVRPSMPILMPTCAPFLMLTGMVARMTVDPPGDLLYILATILFLGLLEKKRLYLGHLPRLSIRRWLTLWLNLPGLRPYYESYVFQWFRHPRYGVITWVLHIYQLIKSPGFVCCLVYFGGGEIQLTEVKRGWQVSVLAGGRFMPGKNFCLAWKNCRMAGAFHPPPSRYAP
ncbi:hypothetical protein E3N88_20181 [Mikania micrantha]|uniref:Uncharacterized protein n=1 Tax=Mikania micrantha TaxID=192012 RepID=A0A5N6NJ35_9ASTR|nr:hypothetical protein E3N88_20181 [Mikania micrantha]